MIKRHLKNESIIRNNTFVVIFSQDEMIPFYVFEGLEFDLNFADLRLIYEDLKDILLGFNIYVISLLKLEYSLNIC